MLLWAVSLWLGESTDTSRCMAGKPVLFRRLRGFGETIQSCLDGWLYLWGECLSIDTGLM
jgi:hypothetical protein